VSRVRVRNGHVVTLCCEGLCSGAYSLDEMFVGKLRAAGYSPDDVRATITGRLHATNHHEVARVTDAKARTITHVFACLQCGHERNYGVDEL
jgi:hypothetical protein